MRALILGAAAALIAGGTALAADGKADFTAKCAGCHSITGKSGPAGPSLKGVLGRKPGSLADFAYSAGLKGKGGTWTAASLDTFLANPSAFSPGSKMFVRVADPAERKALIAYLSTLK